MMNNRYKGWTDVAALDEHLTVFLKMDEALERFLGDIASFSREPYKISTDSGSVERSSHAQISDAVDSHGGLLNALEVWYAGPGCRVSLDVRPFAAYPLYRIGCQLNVFRDDEIENNGRFDSLRNRMDAEIKRQFPPSTAPQQVTAPVVAAPPATGPSATASSAMGFKQWVSGFLRHPIIAPLVVVGVLALIGGLWKVLGG